MKKLSLLPVLCLFTMLSFGQMKIDSAKKKPDTIFMPVPVYYLVTIDTVRLSFIYAKGKNLKKQPGFVVYKGIKDTKGNWVKTPTITLYTNRWKPFKEKLITTTP